MVQISHPYMAIGKTIALIIWTFVGKVMLLPFNMLSRFVTAFLSRSKRLLSSWLQSLSAVILKPKKIKPVTVFTFPPSLCHEVMGLDAMILIFFFNVEFQASFIFSNHCPLLPSSRGSLAPPGHGQPGDGKSEHQHFRN